jgi:methane/ammonia monooxygenase subunit B
METYGLGNGIFWHLFWGLLATAWLLWWVRRPLFMAMSPLIIEFSPSI